ncbi:MULTISPECIES: LacI family DNA-binding transcriptional regulator [unclassified Micromonospora]|uniref:LacI family DNA-binding transcriptional regulator n=1 Tax=unclassified Micromonospora TaxID=2617518 RepID=UPI0013150873|nr:MULTISPECIES: LacI family DNA-binding transcriptional regulator [unclassified Micromonospora]
MSDKQPAASAPDETRVTLVQVAKLAGVSPTTVSHVLSGKRWVAEGTQETVRDVIRQLGYRPNNVARSLRTRRSRMVAVVVPDITNTFYAVLTRGLADAVDGAGYGTYVCNTDGNAEREDAFLADVLDRGVDGVVMAAGRVGAQVRMGPAGSGVPAVCVGGAVDDDPLIDLVMPDDTVGSHAAVTHLIRRGARRIAIIEGPLPSGSAREEGYRQALLENGMSIDPDLMVRGDWTRPGGRRAMHLLMAVPERRPDAVFCANDLTAIGAIDAVHELHLAVPDDVAIVGFDDVDAATIVNPPLTTVRNPAYDIGLTAGELLLSRMDGTYDGEGRKAVLPCPLIVRQSA